MTTLMPTGGPAGDLHSYEVARVVQVWHDSGLYTDQTLTRSQETLTRFAARLSAQGIGSLEDADEVACEGFIQAFTADRRPPEPATRHARRGVLRMAFRALRTQGVPVGDPTLDLALPSKAGLPARPLTDEEVQSGRLASRMGAAGSSSLHRAVVWALAEATAVTSEVSAVRVADFDDPENPTLVELPGAARVSPRVVALTDWGALILSRHLAALKDSGADAATPVAYRGAAEPGQAVAQAATANAVAATLRAAGLRGDPRVKPASVRAWAGRRHHQRTGSIEETARLLGSKSLDATATVIGLDWR